MDIKISVGENKTSVKVSIFSDIGIEKPVFPFTFECGKDYAATLLAKELSDELETQIERIRKEEYRRGYDHAKKRTVRHTWHWVGFQDRKYVNGE